MIVENLSLMLNIDGQYYEVALSDAQKRRLLDNLDIPLSLNVRGHFSNLDKALEPPLALAEFPTYSRIDHGQV